MARLPSLPHRIAPRDTRTAQPGPKVAAAHYGTAEHHAWAKAVIDRAGRKCQGCGATGKRLFADHIVELRDGGSPTDLTNGQAMCSACHTRKTLAARAARQAAIPDAQGGGWPKP